MRPHLASSFGSALGVPFNMALSPSRQDGVYCKVVELKEDL